MHQILEQALRHAEACRELLDQQGLDEALAYCAAQQIEPPHCIGDGPSAEAQTRALLQDCGWWEKRLKLRHVRAARRERLLARRRAEAAAASDSATSQPNGCAGIA
jgi:hypothetical protein